MAKIKAKTRNRGALSTRPYGYHDLSIKVRVVRIVATPKRSFEACAFFSRGARRGNALTTGSMMSPRVGRHENQRGACAFGKNPRAAIKKALAKVGNAVGGRSGAFAGLKGK